MKWGPNGGETARRVRERKREWREERETTEGEVRGKKKRLAFKGAVFILLMDFLSVIIK